MNSNTAKIEDTGILYVAFGQKYLEEALVSAQSVKTHMPDVRIALVTDTDKTILEPIYHSLFNIIINRPSTGAGLQNKVESIASSPFEKTIFMDTDTYACAPFDELFDLLDYFDIAATQEINYSIYPVEGVSDAFPEFNIGVVAFRCSRMRPIFQRWLEIYNEETWQIRGRHYSQPSFRKAIFQSNCRVATLPHNYNCRYEDGGFVTGKVKILHGRTPQKMQTIAKVMNQRHDKRVFIGDRLFYRQQVGRWLVRKVAKQGGVYGLSTWGLLRYRLRQTLAQESWRGLWKRINKRLK